MKYKNLEQIAQEADVHPAVGMSRRERLERWANLLAQQPERRLCAIEGTEFGTRPERLAKRADDSPITVAFQDPVLRTAGLRGDRVGDAVDFFDLSERAVHHLICYCHHGHTVSAGAVAARLRPGAAGRGSCFAGSDRPRRRAVRSGRAWAGGSGALSFPMRSGLSRVPGARRPRCRCGCSRGNSLRARNVR